MAARRRTADDWLICEHGHLLVPGVTWRVDFVACTCPTAGRGGGHLVDRCETCGCQLWRERHDPAGEIRFSGYPPPIGPLS
jgi:hypothetical protein